MECPARAKCRSHQGMWKDEREIPCRRELVLPNFDFDEVCTNEHHWEDLLSSIVIHNTYHRIVSGGIGGMGGGGESGDRQANAGDQGEGGFHLVEDDTRLREIGFVGDIKVLAVTAAKAPFTEARDAVQSPQTRSETGWEYPVITLNSAKRYESHARSDPRRSVLLLLRHAYLGPRGFKNHHRFRRWQDYLRECARANQQRGRDGRDIALRTNRMRKSAASR